MNKEALEAAGLKLGRLIVADEERADMAQQVIEAYLAVLAKIGLEIRPREPTEAMYHAAIGDFWSPASKKLMLEAIQSTWKNMWDVGEVKSGG